MRILVTGATGFLGYHLMNELGNHKEFKVMGISRGEKTLYQRDSKERHLFKEIDLREKQQVEMLLQEFRPEIIIHLAWRGVYNLHHQDLVQHENYVDTLSLITLGIDHGLKSFIGLGSHAEYGPYKKKIIEEDELCPTTLYGKIKGKTGKMAKMLCDQHAVRFIWLRLFSSYGPFDDDRWLIPYVIQELINQRSPKLSHGNQLWDYIFIQDVIDAIMVCLQTNIFGFYNVASGVSRSIRSVVEEIHKQLQSSVELIFGEKPMKEKATKHLEADVSKFMRETYWKPAISLECGIERTIKSILKKEFSRTSPI